MANTLILEQPFVFVGLGTLTYTVASTGRYSVKVQLSENPPSGLSVVVNNNASPVFTAPVITPTQIAQQFKVSLSLTAADVITVVLASSSAIDNQLNTVKTSVSIGLGDN